MAAIIQASLGRILMAGRDRYNALFAQARQQRPSLENDLFADYLRDVIAPIVEAVAQVQPEALERVADVLYIFALEIVGRDLQVRQPNSFGFLPVRLLSSLPAPLASDPQVFAGSIFNALYHLSATPESDPEFWCAQMIALGQQCAQVDLLLTAGQLAAWRAGMAHFREGALEVCRKLPPQLALAALAISEPKQNAEATLAGLAADPWWNPHFPHESGDLRIVGRIGAFRGFGGVFMRPPSVVLSREGHIYAEDGQSWWALYADAFGSVLKRSGAPEKGNDADQKYHFGAGGLVQWGIRSRVFPELTDIASAAANETTLAVTQTLSHAIWLIAR